MCRGNNAQVDRRIEYIVWYRTYLRTDGKLGFKGSNKLQLPLTYFISVRRSLSNSMRVTENVSPLPKVPLGTEMVVWQLHSDDLTSNPSFQGKMLHTMLYDACVC